MKKPSKKKLHGMLSTALKKQAEREKRKDSLSPQMKDTGFACVIPRCKGKIVEEVSYRHLGSDMEMPIGPISPSRYTRVVNSTARRAGFRIIIRRRSGSNANLRTASCVRRFRF